MLAHHRLDAHAHQPCHPHSLTPQPACAPPHRPSRLLDSRRQARGPHQAGAPRGHSMRPTRRHPSAPQHAGPPGCSQVTAVLCTGARGRDTIRAWGNALRGDFNGGSVARRARPPCRPRHLALVPRPEEVSEATCSIPVVSAGIWTREIVL